MQIFFSRLKEARGTRSQRAAAAALGIAQPAYARYESGRSTPSIELLARMAITFDKSADWLLGLPERGGTVSLSNANIGDNNIINSTVNQSAAPAHEIAAPAHEIAAPARAPGEYPHCRQCPYKRDAEALYKITEGRKRQ